MTMSPSHPPEPIIRDFALAPFPTNATPAHDNDKPWYSSLDALPSSQTFNEIDFPTSSSQQQTATKSSIFSSSSPSPPASTRRFSNAEIERLIDEDLDAENDIAAPWGGKEGGEGGKSSAGARIKGRKSRRIAN